MRADSDELQRDRDREIWEMREHSPSQYFLVFIVLYDKILNIATLN